MCRGWMEKGEKPKHMAREIIKVGEIYENPDIKILSERKYYAY